MLRRVRFTLLLIHSLGKPFANMSFPAYRLTPPISPLSSSPERPHNKSVMFAPLSPTSSRRLAKIHRNAEDDPDTIHSHSNGHAQSHHISNSRSDPPDVESSDTTTDPNASYDCKSRNSGDKRPRRRRERRNSDPSSDRPNQPSKHRRRSRNASRSPSPASDNEVEILPDRFDADGRPLDRYGNRFAQGRGLNLGGAGGKGNSEMVERIVREVGDVVDGKKTWKDLLRGFVDEASNAGSPEADGSDGGRRRKRRG